MIKSILHRSDTHGLHRRLDTLPEADVLVHSGDFTMTGTAPEVIDFAEWLCGQRGAVVSGSTTFINGAAMEVLSPAWLREQFAKEAENIVKMYRR